MAKVAPEQVIQGLLDRGYSPVAAAGIAGNLEHESGFDTSIREKTPMTESARKQGGGFGLAQWTSADRKNGLYNMAAMKGVPVDDLDLQLDYLDHELKSTHKKAYNALQSARNPRQAAFAFSRHYEMPSPKYANNASRMSTAEKFFNMLNPIGTANADETPWQAQEVPDLTPEDIAAYDAGQGNQAQEVPDLTPEDIAAFDAANPPEKTAGQKVGEVITDIGGGVLKGASNIGNTILSAADSYNELVGNKNALSSLDSTGDERRNKVTEGLKNMGVDTESNTYKAAELGTEIAGTAGTGGMLAKGASKVAPSMVEALTSGGMKGANLAQKAAGGAITGAASSGLVDPETAVTGGLIGAALPPALQSAGKAGELLGKVVKGSDTLTGAKRAIAEKAIGKGLVIPPSQVKPTFANRLIEGTAGKITTAQNASAKNEEFITNALKKEIGADELTPEGLKAVREKANAAYSNLAKAGKLEADDAFKSSLDKAAARTAKFKEDFPELKNQEVDSLIESLKGKGSFNADTTIEAIKRLRQDSSANRISMDASKKELGRVQAKIAGSLEDLIDRNLESSGKGELLIEFRDARKTLAKTHEIEKAVDPSTGNVTASKLIPSLKRGKLTGELKDIAEFAEAFPKAAQNVSKMGSLPQTSPLDVASVSTLSMMAGHPGYMALLALRPIARKTALSKIVQKGLITQPKADSLLKSLSGNKALKLLPSAAVLAGSQSGRQ